MEQLFAKGVFGLYTLCILGGGLAAVTSRSLVRALVALIIVMFGVAGMYLLLNAPFIALMQLLIYVGAVAVLVFFAIMLVRDPRAQQRWPGTPLRKLALALPAAALPSLLLLWTWLIDPPSFLPDPANPRLPALPVEVPVAELGRGLMQDYLVAFELISVVLFVAMSAAVLLAFKPRGQASTAAQEADHA